jgi:hypothetical protein
VGKLVKFRPLLFGFYFFTAEAAYEGRTKHTLNSLRVQDSCFIRVTGDLYMVACFIREKIKLKTFCN